MSQRQSSLDLIYFYGIGTFARLYFLRVSFQSKHETALNNNVVNQCSVKVSKWLKSL